MSELKHETIKRRAKEEFVCEVGGANREIAGLGDAAPFLAILRQIEQLNTGGKVQPATEILDEWIQYGLDLIDDWDVRCVGRLAEIFPSCVPKHWPGKRLECYIADTEAGDWMVALADQEKSKP